MSNIKKITLKNGDIRYELNAYLGIDPHTGKKKRTRRRFLSHKEARLASAQLKLDMHQHGTNSINAYTFEDVYELWLTNHQFELRATTLASKKSKFRAQILPKFGHLIIQDITTVYCQEVANEWGKKFKTLQDYTIQTSLVFKFAERMGFINKNPMNDIVLPRYHDDNYYTKKERNFLTKNELSVFMELLINEENLQYYSLFRLLAFTGLRKGEALALHWSDIDWDSQTIHIKKSLAHVGGKSVLHHPKTISSIRKISIDPVTLRALNEWKIEQVNFYNDFGFKVSENDTQPIFVRYVHRRKTMDYMREATPNDILNAFFDRHPNLKRIKVHGFRHTHASLLFEAGASLKDVQARLGHGDIQTTMNIYTHVTDTSRERVANMFQDYMNF